MELTMSMFASSADYWKARAELAETTVRETAEALGCEPDNELMLAAAQNAARYRWLREKAPGEICFDHTQSQDEGSHFLLRVPFDGEPINNDAESGMKLDAAIDAALAVGAA